MNRYIVILQDIWNNLTYIGEYDKLEDAIPHINNAMPENYSIDELKEYPSTYGLCFDMDVYDKEDPENETYMVRGFILDK